MEKDTFIVFMEWEENCEDLTDEEFGQLMRAVFQYAKNGEKPSFSDRTMRACWKPIQQAIDRANEAYEHQCEVNRANGKKGGAPYGNQNAKKQKTTETTETSETTLPHPDPDPDPYPDRDPHPNGRSPSATIPHTSKKPDTKNKFKNFDERVYPDEVYENLLGGGQE